MYDQSTYRHWLIGVNRLYFASWSAAALSYGKSAEDITILAEYFSLLSDCLSNIVLALGAEVVLDTDDGNILL
ncbi:MAG: hypothetical protein U0M15_03235 [Bacillota bacterium]|nr:hypothetical protein [Bacillota bacterium]